MLSLASWEKERAELRWTTLSLERREKERADLGWTMLSLARREARLVEDHRKFRV